MQRLMFTRAFVVLAACLLSLPAARADEPVKTVTVKAGETVADIAERELGDRGRWQEIFKLNGLAESAVPAPGTVLKLPPRQGADALLSLVFNNVNHRGPDMPDWLRSAAGAGLSRLWKVKTAEESRAEVSFRDSSRLRLDPKAFLIVYSGTASTAQRTLAEPERAQLVEGNLQAFLSKAKSPVAIATPAARLELDPGSHGRMEVDTTQKSATLSVYAGRGRATAQGDTVQVDVGFASRTIEGQKPGAPVPIPAAPVFSADSRVDALALQGNEATLELNWSAVPNTAFYRLEVSEEATFTRTIRDLKFEATQRRATLKLPPGSYLARLSAIDASAITGFPSRLTTLWVGRPTIDTVFGKVESIIKDGRLTLTGRGELRLRPPPGSTARLSFKRDGGAAAQWQKELTASAGTTRVEITRDGRPVATVDLVVTPLDLVVSKGAVNGGEAEIHFHVASGTELVPVPGGVTATLGGTPGTVTRLDGSRFLFRGAVGSDDTLVVATERIGKLVRNKALERRCWSLSSLGQGCR